MITLISFTIVIGILVFVHEFGHFIVAKRTGVGVEKFSLGFGPKLIGFKRGETEYMISAIPLGGYVKLTGENPDELLTNDPREFGSRSIGVRWSIVFAGPLMNYFLAFILLPLVYIIGIQIPAYLDQPPIVQWVAENSPAKGAGLQRGDRIIAVNKKEVKDWKVFTTLSQSQQGEKVSIQFERDGRIQEKVLSLPSDSSLSGTPGLFPQMDARVGGIVDDSPAEKAGVKPGDHIKKIEGTEITHWLQMSELVKDYLGETISLTIEREGKRVTMSLTPSTMIEKIVEKSPAELAGLREGDIIRSINGSEVVHWKNALINDTFPQGTQLTLGVNRDGQNLSFTVTSNGNDALGIKVSGKSGIIQLDETILKKFNFLSSLKEGFNQVIEMTGLTLWALGKLFTYKLSIKTLGGPILIAKMTGSAAKTGFSSLLIFTAFLSINLSVLNLLPIPILDGGHLFFLLIELIRRKPLETKKIELAQKVGFALLLLLLLTVTYNDIMRSVPKKYLEFFPWR